MIGAVAESDAGLRIIDAPPPTLAPPRPVASDQPDRPAPPVQPGIAAVHGPPLAGTHASAWSSTIRALGLENPPMRVALMNAALSQVTDDSAVVQTPPRYAQALTRALPELARVLSAQLGRELSVRVQVLEPEAGAALTSPDAPASSAPASNQAAEEHQPPRPPFNPNVWLEHPLVKQAIELFGARVVDVQPPVQPPVRR
jgi:hypothetical protein